MKILYVDGFNFGRNPSPTGGGYIITDEHGNIIERETIIKNGWTNNEAELLGVLRTFELIEDNGEVYTDSMNTIYWIKNGRSKARPDLNEYCAKAKDLLFTKKINLLWVAREQNLAGIENEKGLNLSF